MATTINTYSVGLTLDAADYINKASLSGQETRRLSRAIEEARTPAEKYSREIDRITKAVDVGAISLETYSRLLAAAGKKYGFTGQDAKKAAEEQDRLAKVMKEGELVAKSVMTSQEKQSVELRKLSDLYKQGAISVQTYNRAVSQIRSNSDSAKAALERQNVLERQRNQTLEEGRRVTISLLSPQEKHERSLRSLNQLYKAGAVDAVTYRRGIRQADDELKKHTQTVDKATKSHVAIGAQIRSIAAAYVGFSTIKKSISLAIDAEQASASFEVLTGSIEDSTRLLSELRHFSDVTPLSTVGVRDAAKLMLSFNIPLEQVMENLKMLGDISGGSQQRFDSLTLAFAQMSAAGRLMGQDVLQMINAGFNPLQEISRKTGESMLELKKRMEDGAISSLEVRDAFMSATSEGGKYNGMMDRLAETMGGKLAVAMGQLEKAGIQLGQALSPLVIDLTNGFDQGISKVQILVGMVEAMVDGFRMMAAAAKDAFVVIKAIGSGQTYETMTQSVDHVRKLLDEIGERDRKRQEQLEIEARMRMNPATLDPSSPEYKEREERERAAAAAALETTQSTSIGVLASQIGDAISQSGAAFQQRDLLVPTAGEIIIAEAVQDAVDAIKENKFSRIR
jgi:tape measure domain-containing protein